MREHLETVTSGFGFFGFDWAIGFRFVIRRPLFDLWFETETNLRIDRKISLSNVASYCRASAVPNRSEQDAGLECVG